MNKKTKKLHAAKAFSKFNLLSKKGGVESLKSEISIMKKLNHPNIVKFEEIQETKNTVYIIMEHLEGNTLFDKAPKDLNEVRIVMQTLLKGIIYLEKHQIAHKDLKPDNILFKKNCDPSSLKIIDFGLAANFTDKTNLLKIAGTPGFFAPEILKKMSEKRKIHLASKLDVYSAGVILYGYLFDFLPFEGQTPEEVLGKNQKGEFEFCDLSSMKKEFRCPTALDLLEKMMEKDPEVRYSATQVLEHEFFCKLEGDSVPNDPVSQGSMYLGNNINRPNLLRKLREKFCLKKVNF